MKLEIQGEPDDLIRRCDSCDYCIFEDILSVEQRQIKVLENKNPKKHIHRVIIEQLCGLYYDDVCPMKYAAMKAAIDDRTAMQMGVVKNYVWDLGKKYRKKVKYQQAMREWTKPQNLGRDLIESYAKRYGEIWDKGIRETKERGEIVEKQIFTADLIYEIVMAKTKTYRDTLALLNTFIAEHGERDKI